MEAQIEIPHQILRVQNPKVVFIQSPLSLLMIMAELIPETEFRIYFYMIDKAYDCLYD